MHLTRKGRPCVFVSRSLDNGKDGMRFGWSIRKCGIRQMIPFHTTVTTRLCTFSIQASLHGTKKDITTGYDSSFLSFLLSKIVNFFTIPPGPIVHHSYRLMITIHREAAPLSNRHYWSRTRKGTNPSLLALHR